MNVRIFQYPLETGQYVSNIVMAGLNIDEHDRPGLLGPAVDLLDDPVRHDHPVHTVLTGRPLSHHRDQVQSRLHRHRRICSLPSGHFRLQFLQHLILGKLTQGTHFLRERIAIVGDDPLFRQDRTGQRLRAVDRPAAFCCILRAFSGIVLYCWCRLARAAGLGLQRHFADCGRGCRKGCLFGTERRRCPGSSVTGSRLTVFRFSASGQK